MSDILNENQADNIVIKNLLKEINRLKGLNKMGKILLDTNGDLYLAEVYTPFAEIDAENLVDRAKKEIAEYEDALKLSNELQAQAAAPATEAPAPAPEAPAVPVVEQPAPAPAPVEAPQQPAPETQIPATPEVSAPQPAASPIVIQ